MQIYLVGGAVRDRLLGIANHDRDWVVVGGSAQELAARGFIPVGQDFPVFLHPETHEEYALARTERKHGRGYAGFTFFTGAEVTLEEDLSRRDLTINAMALDASGRLIDPFGGKKDLENGILRHIGPAFAEDPVRVLRVARFAARYGFTVAEETRQLMRTMTANGEVSALVPERVWQETAKGLMEKTPSKMFDVLRDCGAAAVILPEIDALFGVPQRADYHPEIDCGRHTMMALDYAAAQGYTLPERYAVLCHDLGKALTPKEILPKHHGHEQRGIAPVKTLNKRLNVPRECASLALTAAEYHGSLHAVGGLRAATIADILHRCDALRRPERFQAALRVCVADTRGRLTFENAPYPQKEIWEKYLSACLKIDYAAIAAAQDNPQKIPEAVRNARISVIRALQTQENG